MSCFDTRCFDTRCTMRVGRQRLCGENIGGVIVNGS